MGEASRRRALRAQDQTMQPSVLRASRIVIVEWLSGDEQRTGAELKARLEARNGHFLPVELFTCDARAEVFDALDDITRSVRGKGTPILHIEAHGSPDYDALVGPGGESITWEELAPPLRRLNLATGFNLMVVAAACLSEAILFSVGMNEVLPYVATISFRTKVTPSRLREAMLELYRALVIEGKSADEAADRANRELDADQRLRFTEVPGLIRSSVAKSLDQFTGEEFKSYQTSMIARVSLENGRHVSLGAPELKRFMFDAQVNVVQTTIAKMLAYDQIPGNKQRFGFDARAFVENELRRRLQR